MTLWEQIIAAVLPSLIGGTAIGAWLVHRREGPKSEADVNDSNWQRFQNEINRLDVKVKLQADRIDTLENSLREERIKGLERDNHVAALEAENARLRWDIISPNKDNDDD